MNRTSETLRFYAEPFIRPHHSAAWRTHSISAHALKPVFISYCNYHTLIIISAPIFQLI